MWFNVWWLSFDIALPWPTFTMKTKLAAHKRESDYVTLKCHKHECFNDCLLFSWTEDSWVHVGLRQNCSRTDVCSQIRNPCHLVHLYYILGKRNQRPWHLSVSLWILSSFPLDHHWLDIPKWRISLFSILIKSWMDSSPFWLNHKSITMD